MDKSEDERQGLFEYMVIIPLFNSKECCREDIF